jgi:flagellar motility protein MotE (MotC chaperone)
MKRKSGKIRVNISVDRKILEKAKTKLRFFGGKLSTLFGAYLEDFVSSMQNQPNEKSKIAELEERIKVLENKIKNG